MSGQLIEGVEAVLEVIEEEGFAEQARQALLQKDQLAIGVVDVLGLEVLGLSQGFEDDRLAGSQQVEVVLEKGGVFEFAHEGKRVAEPGFAVFDVEPTFSTLEIILFRLVSELGQVVHQIDETLIEKVVVVVLEFALSLQKQPSIDLDDIIDKIAMSKALEFALKAALKRKQHKQLLIVVDKHASREQHARFLYLDL